MKKLLAILFIVIIAAPSVALASWWNPFSWFKKKEVIPQVQVEKQRTSEEKISELQKQLDDLKKSQLPSAPTTTTQVTNKEVKKTTSMAPIPPKLETMKKVVDVCGEIEGVQNVVPMGYIKYGSGPCLLLSSQTQPQAQVVTPTPAPVLTPKLSQEKAADIKNQISLYIKKLNDQIDVLRNTKFDTGNINHDYTTLKEVAENPGYLNWGAIAGYAKLQNQIIPLNEMIRHLNVISFEVQDYADYGTILSADERAYLADIGIKF